MAAEKEQAKPGAWSLWSALPRVRPYMRPYRRLTYTSTGLTFLSAIVALAEPWPLAIIVDNVLGDQKTGGIVESLVGTDPGRYTLLVFAVLAGFLLTFLSHGITVISDWTSAKLNERMVLDLRSDLFEHTQGLSLTFHDGRLTGKLMNQINNQASSIGVIVGSIPPIAQALLTLIGMFTIAFLLSWQVAVVSLVAVPFIWYSLGLYGTRIVPRLQRVQSLEGQSLSIVMEAMSMLRVIVSFGREGYEYDRFRDQGETAVDERIKLTVRQTLFSLGVTSATAIGTGLVLGVGTWQVLHGSLTTGELLVLIAYIAAVYQPLEEISNTIGGLNATLVAFTGSIGLLDTEKEVKESPDAIDIGKSTGAVAFEDVSFAYKGRKNALTGVSFQAEPGQKVAIVGPTGAGKTTLISLLIRFYDPKSGRVLIDGHDTRELTLESLRNQISVVLQEPLLFSGSVADNIRYGRLEASMDEVIEAARAANAHDFVSKMPEGYDTELGERGAQLSGGERQRISVARAFIKDAPILILDEPTSSIDSKTEGVILDALEELMVGRTSFMIAHRLSTIRDADLILVMKDGRLVEQGSHNELLDRGGTYCELHDAQNRPRIRRTRHLAGASARRGQHSAAGPATTEVASGNGASTNGHPRDDAVPAIPPSAKPPAEEKPDHDPPAKLKREADPAPKAEAKPKPKPDASPYIRPPLQPDASAAVPPAVPGAATSRLEPPRWRRLVVPLVALGVLVIAGIILASSAGDEDPVGGETGSSVVVEQVYVGDRPTGLALASDQAYVSRAEPGLVSVALGEFQTSGESYPVVQGSADIASTLDALWVVSTGETGLTRVDVTTGGATAIDLPDGIPVAVAGSGDDVWVALDQVPGPEGEQSAILRIDAEDNRVLATTPVPGGIGDVAAEPDSVWIANASEQTLTRLDAETGRTERVPVSSEPGQLAAGDGAIWMNPAGTASVVRIDPATGQETGEPVRLSSAPAALAVTPAFLYSIAAGAGQLERVRLGP